jgi:G3E family GTPase
VNDFGSIDVDAGLVVDVDVEDSMISLANGCVCCQLRDDLVESVAELLGRDEPVEYVILEASGVADPASIYMTFVDSAYRDRIRLDSVTCVVDAEQILTDDDPDLIKLKLQQIGFADLVILNKVDLAGVEGATTVKRWIDSHFTRVRLVPAIDCDVPLEILLGVGRFDAASSRGGHAATHSRDRGHGSEPERDGALFSTQTYTGHRPLRRRLLERMIKRDLPADMYRCKGFVHLADDPENRYVLQVVGRRVDLVLDRPWGSDEPGTRVVSVARTSTQDSDLLSKLFGKCAEDTEVTEAGGSGSKSACPP